MCACVCAHACACLCLPRSTLCRRTGVAGPRMNGFPDRQRAMQSGRTSSGDPRAGREGVSEDAAQCLPVVGMFGEPCVWDRGLPIPACLGGSLAPALRDPRACWQGRVVEGDSDLQLQFRGAPGFPAPAPPPCPHYLFNRLFDSGGAEGRKGMGEGLGRATLLAPLTPDGALNEQYLCGQLSVTVVCL